MNIKMSVIRIYVAYHGFVLSSFLLLFPLVQEYLPRNASSFGTRVSVKKRNECCCRMGVWYTSRSAGEAAAHRRFFQNLLHSATPPTPEQPDFVWEQILNFKRVARQNPPVLQPLEMACSGSKHPFSSVGGRRRYNTLDFPQEKLCANRALSPLLETQNQGNSHPFGNLAACMHLYIQTEKRGL